MGIAPVLRRLLVTTFVLLVFAAGARVPLPGIDALAARQVMGDAASLVSLRPLGIEPFLGAFLFVEVTAVVLPSLRRLRRGSARARLPLVRAAWLVAAGLAAWQGWALAAWLQLLRSPLGLPVLEAGTVPALLVAATAAASVLLLGWLASLVTAHGLGNGFALLFAWSAGEHLLGMGRFAARWPGRPWSGDALVGLLAVAAVAALLLARPRVAAAGPTLPLPTCGLAVAGAPEALLGFAAAMAAMLPTLGPLSEWLRAESGWGYAADAALAAVLAAILGRAFCPAGPVLLAWRNASGGPGDDRAVRRALAQAHRRSLGIVVAVSLLPAAGWLLGAPVGLDVGTLLQAAILVAVLLDLRDEARARRAGPLVPVASLQRVYAVAPALAALARAGIPTLARSRRYRSLFHFFAPYAPIELLVPEGRAAEAETVCAAVLGEARA